MDKSSNMRLYYIYLIWYMFIILETGVRGSWQDDGGNDDNDDIDDDFSFENVSANFDATANETEFSSTTTALPKALTTHSFNHSSFQTTESNSGNLRVKSTVKSTTKKSYLYSTPQKFTFVQLNSTTSRPIIPTSTVVNVVIEPSTTQHNLKHSTNRPIVEGANEPVLGSLWDGWRRLLTRNFWKVRIHDNHYIMQLLIPVALGILVAWIIIMAVLITRCILQVKRQRRLKSKRMAYYNKGESSDKWMLLEHECTSEDSEQEAV